MGSCVDTENVVVGAEGGLDTEQVEAIKGAEDSIKAGHLFRVTRRRDVVETVGVGDERDVHVSREQDAMARHKGERWCRIAAVAKCGLRLIG
jgi:hypothetical protein